MGWKLMLRHLQLEKETQVLHQSTRGRDQKKEKTEQEREGARRRDTLKDSDTETTETFRYQEQIDWESNYRSREK